MSTARSLQFPLPLSSTVEQLWIWGSAQGYGREDDAGLVRLFLPGNSEAVKKNAGINDRGATLHNETSEKNAKIGMIGLGAMGQGMAASLLRGGYTMTGYDMSATAVNKFVSHDGKAVAARNPTETVRGSEVVIMMVQNGAQVDDILFGDENAAESLSNGATIIISSTVPPSYIRDLEKRLQALNKRVTVVDAPVSGGAGRAANGTLAVRNFRIVTSDRFTNLRS